MWAVHRVHPGDGFVRDLLPDLKKNYEGWEKRHFAPGVGLFWQTGHDDGMEFNINSRQTKDILRGAPGYRPTLNAYLWADALAIARVADLAGDGAAADAYRKKAAGLKENLQTKLWDPKREFFFHMFKQDEEADGFKVKKGKWRVLAGAEYRSDKAVSLNVVIRWKKGLPAKRDEPWFLMTNLSGNAVGLTDLYARRMAVEELFRDGKDGRYGLGLGQAQVTTTARLDRLILNLALALAIILLIGLGRVARERFRPGVWCSSNNQNECSDVTVGRRMWDQIDEPPERLITEVVPDTSVSVGNWG